MVREKQINKLGETMRFLGTGYKQYKNNPSDLKIGERVEFNGHSSSTNRVFEVVSIWDNQEILEKHNGLISWGAEIHITYTLRNVKKNGELGNIRTTVNARKFYRGLA
tara:strand:- start:331 stop:654 length:324 start_codon:yes stop_codon:yes gene_type:complete